MLVWLWFLNTRKKLVLHLKKLGMVLNCGAQADARSAKQVIFRGGLAVARGIFVTGT